MAAGTPYLIEMICCLVDHGVDFVICGGMAAVYHGVERMTMDLDISLKMEKENVERFLAATREMRLTPRAPVPAESLLNPEQIRFFVHEKNALVFTFWDNDCPYRQIDVFLGDDKSHKHLSEHSIEANVDGRAVKIVSIEKLYEMKSKMPRLRDKDRLDIKALERLMGKDS